MPLALVALCCALSLLVGVAVGVWAERPRMVAPPVEPPPAPSPPSVLEERLYAGARDAARAALGPEADEAKVEGLARTLSQLSAEAWSVGVSDLRASLVERSGLPPALADFAASTAINALEQVKT